jgi:hypothetical protein
MGQLDVYSLEDISIISLMVSPSSTYLSEEIEDAIESVGVYIYSISINISTNICKKRIKIKSRNRFIENSDGAAFSSWNFLRLFTKKLSKISKQMDDKIMWQDPAISQ